MDICLHFHDGYTKGLSRFPRYEAPIAGLQSLIEDSSESSLDWKDRLRCVGKILRVVIFLIPFIPLTIVKSFRILLSELLLHYQPLKGLRFFLEEWGMITKALISTPVYLMAIAVALIHPESLLGLCHIDLRD